MSVKPCEVCGETWAELYHVCPQNAHSAKSEAVALTGGPNDVGLAARRLFIEMLEAQERKGLAEYGRLLAASNGRDVFADLLAEMVDAWQYAVQARIERAAIEQELAAARHALKSARHSLELIRDAGGSSADRCEAEMALRMMAAAEGVR